MPNSAKLAPAIQQQIDALRQRIRRYVWIEGLAIGVIWLCLTFWVGWAIDYLPVRMGSSEMPRGARVFLLIVISLVLLFILYRFVLRRAFAQLRARNLAVLVERTFPEFHDSLVTAVELDEHAATSELERSLLSAAKEEAAERMGKIDVDKVLNYRPLLRACAAAALLMLSITLFGVFASTAFGVWFQRLYGLSDELYPRRTQIEAVGFDDGEITVARGSDLRIRIRADAGRDTPPPKVCTIYFTTSRGRRGRVNMSKQGVVRDGFQYYLYEGKPFRNILAGVEFDVVGGDHRLTNQRVNVVDSPQVTDIQVQSSLPDYTELLPRNESYHGGMQLVRGSSLELVLTTNKPVVEATITDTVTEEVMTISLDSKGAQQFAYAIDDLQSAISHDIALLDHDGILSTRPYRIAIGAVEDQPPRVNARLKAIGNAVTPDAILPIEGDASDDFGIQRVWAELVVGEGASRELQTDVAADDRLEMSVDLRKLRREGDDPLQINVDSSLYLAVVAQDYCDIGAEGNIGESDRYELEVVTPSQLLALLEARELGLRKRFEQIIGEVQETRDSLSHVQAVPPSKPGTNPSESASNNSADSDDTESENPGVDVEQPEIEEAVRDPGSTVVNRARERALMQLRVQRGFQHSQRAAQEILGVALSFDDIRQELINNRIDSADRQTRMERDISTPLKSVAGEMFPLLSNHLKELETSLNDKAKADALAVAAIRQLDEILAVLKLVRDKMLDLETYNELIDQLRALIREQNDLIDKTKKKRKQSALELLK